MTEASRLLGIQGEEFAAKHLERNGFTILERNWHCQAGEADIIAMECGTLVFVEVKTRRGVEKGFPEEAVTKAKRRRYEIIAAYYLCDHELPSLRVRFDVVSIVITGPKRAFLRHHRDVFACGE